MVPEGEKKRYKEVSGVIREPFLLLAGVCERKLDVELKQHVGTGIYSARPRRSVLSPCLQGWQIVLSNHRVAIFRLSVQK